MTAISDPVGTVYVVVEMVLHGAYMSERDAEAQRDAVQEAGGVVIVEPVAVAG